MEIALHNGISCPGWEWLSRIRMPRLFLCKLHQCLKKVLCAGGASVREMGLCQSSQNKGIAEREHEGRFCCRRTWVIEFASCEPWEENDFAGVLGRDVCRRSLVETTFYRNCWKNESEICVAKCMRDSYWLYFSKDLKINLFSQTINTNSILHPCKWPLFISHRLHPLFALLSTNIYITIISNCNSTIRKRYPRFY